MNGNCIDWAGGITLTAAVAYIKIEFRAWDAAYGQLEGNRTHIAVVPTGLADNTLQGHTVVFEVSFHHPWQLILF